ncbi:hypothetical protein FDP41_012101 [Naegleria fowleri]|uniref:Uncharacterized protein n=1 Tax=Naegleria fowleri TaxID=5763 RepID=A0A6A5C4Q7_NAEFO|nr:uncharacterized protein FDP41_012101 [Naegleria fowleri]KAF0981444.1 hypothetical protein FDP41_012101 [Naegleria fowleri]
MSTTTTTTTTTTTETSLYASFQSVQFPILNTNMFKPLQVKNYIYLPPVDSPVIDFCQTVEQQNSTLKLMVSTKSQFLFPTWNMRMLDCMDYFCLNPLNTANMTARLYSSEIFRTEFAFIFNHCFLCDSSSAIQFRQTISVTNHTCPNFPTTLSNVVNMMTSHCLNSIGISQGASNLTLNNDTPYSKDGKGIHFGIMDARYYEPSPPSIYSLTFSKVIPKDPSKDTLSYFMNLYFPLTNKSLFDASSLPMFCHCGNTNDYAYRCYDVNHAFLAPYKYFATCIIFLVVTMVTSVLFVLGVILPRCSYCYGVLSKNRRFNKDEAFFFGSTTTGPRQYLRAIFLLTLGDIKAHSIFWNSILLVFSYLTQIFSLTRNFSMPILKFVIDDVGGTLRAFVFISLGLCFCCMVIHWSHTLDLINKGKSKGLLSWWNTAITIFFYVFFLCFVIAGIISLVVTGQTSIFFQVLSIFYFSLSILFCVAFSIAGITILVKMRKTRSGGGSASSVLSVKLTKSMMILNVSNFLLAIIAALSFATYYQGWDVFTVELGLLRSTSYDVLLLFASNCINYILYSSVESEGIYGKRVSEGIHRFINCECLGGEGGRKQQQHYNPSTSTANHSTELFKDKQVERVKSHSQPSSPQNSSPSSGMGLIIEQNIQNSDMMMISSPSSPSV